MKPKPKKAPTKKQDPSASRESDALQRDLKILKTDLMLQQVAKKSENPPASSLSKPKRVSYPGSTKRSIGPKKPLNDDLALVKSGVKEAYPNEETTPPRVDTSAVAITDSAKSLKAKAIKREGS